MAQIAVDNGSYKVKTEKVRRLVSEVAEAKSDIGSREDNLRVSGVSRMYKLHGKLINLMKSYGSLEHV